MTDKAASDWLKATLQSALARDPVDALNDALLLVATLEDRLRIVLGLSTGREPDCLCCEGYHADLAVNDEREARSPPKRRSTDR